jgi:hypothetical protein
MFLTIDEIYKKYDGEWIYAIDCEENEVGMILGGKVILHSPVWNDIFGDICEYEKTVHDTLALIQYVGQPPEGTSFLV